MKRDRLLWPIKRRLSSAALVAGILLASGVVAQTLCTATAQPDEAPFLAANDAAMTRMMDGMAVRPSGDADADFAAMMIPHHQGAIEMAEAELRFGRNEQLRRIAQEIIVDQQGEIVAMRLALGQRPPPSAPAPTGNQNPVAPARAPHAARHLMSMPMEQVQ